MKEHINEAELYEIIELRHSDPHNFLGMHKFGENQFVNVFKPSARNITVVNLKTNKKHKMEMIHDAGLFTVKLGKKAFKYKLEIEEKSGVLWETRDPYSFAPVISDMDLYLFGEGNHYEIYKKLGAHLMTVDETEGVLFAVWAPNARRVSVVGDFCGWDGRNFQMRNIDNSGVYELFVPNVKAGDMYKYEIRTLDDRVITKSDPYGNAMELRPGTASIVTDISNFEWHDSEYMKKNADYSLDKNKPMSVYEVHLGSWKKSDRETGFLTYDELADDLVNYVEEMGYTHVELMPVSEHPFDGSWGYQVTGYYAATARYGSPKEFMHFVDRCHEKGIGVILDWVPAHFPKDVSGLAQFDGSYLYEHADPRQGEHPHWGTLIFNVGRNEVKNFLIANALFWLGEYHIDALRVDAVASMLYLDYGKEDGQWVPNQYGGRENLETVEFLKHMNSIISKKFPNALMIAEESTAWGGVSRPVEEGGLGFNIKWNMGWMNDFLSYMSEDPINRKYHHNELTFSMVYAYTENFMLVLSHDEVVHGKGSMINKMPGDYWQKFANLRLSYGFMYSHPGKKLMFMGDEIGQFDEWNVGKSIDWHLLEFEKHYQIQQYVKALNHLYKQEPALWKYDFDGKGFEWINCSDYEASYVSYVRYADKKEDTLVILANFTPVPRFFHTTGVPYAGKYEEIFNSDSFEFGGSGVINDNIINSVERDYDGKDHAIDLRVPPLGVTILKYCGE